jgi:hypothetical protein
LGDFAGRQRKKRKEELHKLLSMRPLCSFVAFFLFFAPSVTFTDLHWKGGEELRILKFEW